MIARGGTWDTNLKVVARKTPRRAMPVPYKSLRKDPKPRGGSPHPDLPVILPHQAQWYADNSHTARKDKKWQNLVFVSN